VESKRQEGSLALWVADGLVTFFKNSGRYWEKSTSHSTKYSEVSTSSILEGRVQMPPSFYCAKNQDNGTPLMQSHTANPTHNPNTNPFRTPSVVQPINKNKKAKACAQDTDLPQTHYHQQQPRGSFLISLIIPFPFPFPCPFPSHPNFPAVSTKLISYAPFWEINLLISLCRNVVNFLSPKNEIREHITNPDLLTIANSRKA